MIDFQKSKKRRKSSIKKCNTNFQRLKEKHVVFATDLVNQLSKEPSYSEENNSTTDSILISTLSYPASSITQPDSSTSNQPTAAIEFDFNFLPPKSDFFLYTVHEHQMLTKKTFGYKKKLYNSLLSSSLSKSDSNIFKSCDNKSFI